MTDKTLESSPYDSWAEYYDLTDADRRPFIAFYRSVLAPTTRSLLELGCGTGTIAIALAGELRPRHGASNVRIVGLDQSAGMLNVARRRDPTIEWLQRDICTPGNLGTFDIIVCCFNTLQHLLTDAELETAFGVVKRLLSDRGVFAFDIYQPNPRYLGAPHTNYLARSVVSPSGKTLEIREDTSYDPASRVLSISWRLVDPAAGGEPLARTQYGLRQYARADLERLIANAGLSVRERYGDFDRSSLSPDSRKQIFVCARS